jgi:hypothetical protein
MPVGLVDGSGIATPPTCPPLARGLQSEKLRVSTLLSWRTAAGLSAASGRDAHAELAGKSAIVNDIV